MRSLSILAVTSELPWPLNSGGHLRTYHLLREMSRWHRVRLVSPTPGGEDTAVQALESAGICVRPVRLGAAKALSAGARVATAALRSEPYVMYRRHAWRPVERTLRLEAASQPPDVLYLDHLDSFVYTRHRHAPVIVGDMHNIYSLLATRAASEQPRGAVGIYLRSQAGLLETVEARAAGLADVLFAVSDVEREYFARLGRARVAVIPNGVDCERFRDLPSGRTHGQPTVLYLGAMSWQPNANAAIFLAREVMPAVRAAVPDARLLIVGRDPNPEVQSLAALPYVQVTGGVPDVVPSLREAHVLAVPLEAGGGTRLKILEAFAAGLPVVSTPVGAEGIEADAGRHLILAQRDGFADALTSVLASPSLGTKLAREARQRSRERYDWKSIGAQASEVIAEALDRSRA
jgi:glycosyltransferase involved in cell wall biosynthesis